MVGGWYRRVDVERLQQEQDSPLRHGWWTSRGGGGGGGGGGDSVTGPEEKEERLREIGL